MGGKRTCKMCHTRFYRDYLINRKQTYWCFPCWKKREDKIAHGNKKLRQYHPLIIDFTKNKP